MMQTVLIVEDDPLNCELFEKILSKRGGLTVKKTENVDQIIQWAEDKSIDLVLIDIALCHSFYQGKLVDGIQISKLLKSNPQTASLPVVLVTAGASAYTFPRDRALLLKRSGADEYIAKPITDHHYFLEQLHQCWNACNLKRLKNEQLSNESYSK